MTHCNLKEGINGWTKKRLIVQFCNPHNLSLFILQLFNFIQHMVGINVGHKDNEKLNWIETTYRYYVINELLINCATQWCADFYFLFLNYWYYPIMNLCFCFKLWVQTPMVVINEDMIFVYGGEKLLHEKLTKKVGWRSMERLWRFMKKWKCK